MVDRHYSIMVKTKRKVNYFQSTLPLYETKLFIAGLLTGIFKMSENQSYLIVSLKDNNYKTLIEKKFLTVDDAVMFFIENSSDKEQDCDA